MKGLVSDVKRAYEEGANSWAEGPSRVYRRLAEALVEESSRPLTGALALDLGTGTGVASEVLKAAGARPVGVDLAVAMVAHRREARPPGSVGNALALPFRSSAFDAVVAAFSLNHLPDPMVGLRETRRVAKAGGVVLASTFPSDADHPAKAVVEQTLEEFGYRRPGWYEQFKQSIADLTGEPERLAAAAAEAGLREVTVSRRIVDAGLDDPGLVVAWRLNMPHTMGFVGELEPRARRALQRQAVSSLPSDLPSTVEMLALVARVP